MELSLAVLSAGLYFAIIAFLSFVRETVNRRFHAIEITSLISYKLLLDLVFMKEYLAIFSYLFNNVIYELSLNKWLLSWGVFFFFICFLYQFTNYERDIYKVFVRFIITICIIPALSVYTCFNIVPVEHIIQPVLFWAILLFLIKKSAANEKVYKEVITIPKVRQIDLSLLVIFGVLSIAIWSLAGRPIVVSIDDSLEQRMIARTLIMPAYVQYTLVFLGGVSFPYLYAKFIDKKKYLFSAISFVMGLLLFFVNGMKTWFLLYIIFFFILGISRIAKDNVRGACLCIDFAFVIAAIICSFSVELFDSVSIMSQFSRVTIIPNSIGFKTVNFFSNNELLYLRESILRGIADSPYLHGSDFYINYGASSTITSARANNGLWGDAYKNFGMLGIIGYPFLYSFSFSLVEKNGRTDSFSLRLHILFICLWNAINLSFFTWLLTGGVIICIILEKINKSNQLYEKAKYEREE